jgi:hypothetical protein
MYTVCYCRSEVWYAETRLGVEDIADPQMDWIYFQSVCNASPTQKFLKLKCLLRSENIL